MPIPEELLQRIRDNDLTLTSLKLENNQIGPPEAQALATALQNNTALISLTLAGNQIGNEGAKALATVLQKNATLKSLYLEGNQIGPEGAKALATALQTNTNLTILHLGYNQIGDEGASALATLLQNNTALTILYLSNSEIKASGLQALAIALENNSILTILDLGHHPELEGNTALDTIYAITEGNIKIPKISRIVSRIIYDNSEEKFSIPQIKFISDSSRPRNCVKILENLVKNVSNENILNVLQRTRDMIGSLGAMILFTAIKAQESNLPQNKLSLPEDKLKLVKDALTEMNLANWFKAKGVTKEGVKNGLGDKSGKIQLNTNTENLILEYLKRDDIKKIPQTTVCSSRKLTVNLVNNSACNPKGYCTIS